MSKIKHPQEKKRKSYRRDCRNDYGENDKSSRKNIRRNKQLGSKLLRHQAKVELSSLAGRSLGEDDALTVEGNVKTAERIKRLKGFKKVSDRPLEVYLSRKAKQHEAGRIYKQSLFK